MTVTWAFLAESAATVDNKLNVGGWRAVQVYGRA